MPARASVVAFSCLALSAVLRVGCGISRRPRGLSVLPPRSSSGSSATVDEDATHGSLGKLHEKKRKDLLFRRVSSSGSLFVRGGSTRVMGAANVSEEAMAILSVVPVFALTDEQGRPVLVQSNESTAKPQQLWFTDVNVARAHAGHIMKLSEGGLANKPLQLKLAMSNLEQVRATVAAATATEAAREQTAKAAPPSLADREVRVCADPREVHVARQLLLRAAGYVNSRQQQDANDGKTSSSSSSSSASAPTSGPASEEETGSVSNTPMAIDFANETVVALEATKLQALVGMDFERDVPLFTLAALNATIEGAKVVQPWFLSFADLVRAYVNSTVPADADETQYKQLAQAALAKMLEVGETAVTTLDKLLRAMQNGNDAVFIMPPASSVDAVSKARLAAADKQGGLGGASSSSSSSSSQRQQQPSAASLFDDDDDDKHSDLFGP